MLSSEQLRRIFVRFATGMLIFVLGPAGAWDVSGLNGLLAYILIHTISRFGLAQFSSDSEPRALRFYKYSPLLLVLGGMAPSIQSGWETQVVLVAIFFGSYEGAYWTSFHGVRRAVSEFTDEADDDSIDKFQKWEVIATFFGAILVLLMEDQTAGLIGGGLALAAFALPYDQLTKDALFGLEASRIGKSTSDTKSFRPETGMLITRTFGMMVLAVSSALRIVCLDVGGSDLLAIIVGAFALIGYLFKKLREGWARAPIASSIKEHYSEHPSIVGSEKLRGVISGGVKSLARNKKAMQGILKIVDPNKEDPIANEIRKDWKAIDYANWKFAHYVVLIGTFVMCWSLIMDLNSLLTPLTGTPFGQKPYFLIGYAFYVFANSGILRPLEIEFADDLLKGGKIIGRREREKFTQQAKLVCIISIVWIILIESKVEPTLEWIVYFALFWASLCAVANVILGNRAKRIRHREGSPKTGLR